MSDFQDKQIECVDCHEPFLFEAGEQEFFASRNFSEPKRCKGCRQRKKAQREERNAQRDPQDGVAYADVWQDDQSGNRRRGRGRGRR